MNKMLPRGPNNAEKVEPMNKMLPKDQKDGGRVILMSMMLCTLQGKKWLAAPCAGSRGVAALRCPGALAAKAPSAAGAWASLQVP